MPRVIVGLSGGVDSSVTAWLLKEQGYEVIGVFMHNCNNAEQECYRREDSTDAMLVAQQLGIPFHILDMSEMYEQRIIEYMFQEYANGRTPNPDILCNREIKFDFFLKKSLSLKADFIATGHYARREKLFHNHREIYRLLAGIDHEKDQSYFLCQLNQEQLSKSLFPLGKLKKREVRKYAEKIGLITAKKKDSQGLCFVGKVKLPDFLKKKIKPQYGDIIKIPTNQVAVPEPKEETWSMMAKKTIYNRNCGKVIGTHPGAYYFTKGQRKGLRIGGQIERLFVIDTDIEKNIVYVGMGKNHPGLYKRALFVKENDIHWVRSDLALNNGKSLEVTCRIRYRQPLQRAFLHKVKIGLYTIFEQPQWAITEGQFVAWYLGEELIGSGIIS